MRKSKRRNIRYRYSYTKVKYWCCYENMCSLESHKVMHYDKFGMHWLCRSDTDWKWQNATRSMLTEGQFFCSISSLIVQIQELTMLEGSLKARENTMDVWCLVMQDLLLCLLPSELGGLGEKWLNERGTCSALRVYLIGKGENQRSPINTFIEFFKNSSGLPFFFWTKFRKKISQTVYKLI